MPVTPTDPLITLAARNTGLPADVVAAQVNVESEGNPNAVSPAGAEGEFQFLPSTYVGLGFPAGTEFDPAIEVRAYEKYMTELLQWAKGDVRQALAAYNAGQGNWQAGLGYADTILHNAQQGTGLKVGTSQQPSSVGVGGLSGFFSTILKSLNFSFWSLGVPDVSASTSDIAQAVSAVALPLVKFAEAIDWFMHPSHWVRLLAGVGGGALVLGGVWQMSHAGAA